MEFIESTGDQYLLTDIIPKSNDKIVADLYLSSIITRTTEYAFLGARDSSSNRGVE